MSLYHVGMASSVRCPTCNTAIYWQPSSILVLARQDFDGATHWLADSMVCPECEAPIIYLEEYVASAGGAPTAMPPKTRQLVVPRASSWPAAPPEVPAAIRKDYMEACAVIEASPNASAALSRRCLQSVLREIPDVKPGTLADEIDQVLDMRILQSSIASALEAPGRWQEAPGVTEAASSPLAFSSG